MLWRCDRKLGHPALRFAQIYGCFLSTKISAEAQKMTLARSVNAIPRDSSMRCKKRPRRGCLANCRARKGDALARQMVPMAKNMKPGISGTAKPTKPSTIQMLPTTARMSLIITVFRQLWQQIPVGRNIEIVLCSSFYVLFPTDKSNSDTNTIGKKRTK